MKRIDLVAVVPNELEAEVSAKIVELVKANKGEVKTHHVVTLKDNPQGTFGGRGDER